MEFFRHCPECGRRFHIKVVDKKLTNVDRETVQAPPEIIRARGPIGGGGRIVAGPITGGYILEEGVPVTIDIEEFQYAYKCKHCGHEWYEKHTEKHAEKPQQG